MTTRASSTSTATDRAPKPDLYETVTARIVAELEKGAAPWVQPWSVRRSDAFPRNGVSGRFYQGNNIVLLWIAAHINGYESNEWFTYKQAQAAGGQVRRGERGTQILFSGRAQVRDDEQDEPQEQQTGATRTRRVLKTYTVFNRAQIDGLPEPVRPAPKPEAQRMEEAEAFLSATGAKVMGGQSLAAYYIELDVIAMPALGAFTSAAHYYATHFHESTHWTGARSRLRRPELGAGKIGSPEYAQEELTAELGSALLCAHFGINGDLRHPGYIAHYMKHLANDKTAFFRACTAARQAVEYLFSLTGYVPQTAEQADAEDEEEEPTAKAA